MADTRASTWSELNELLYDQSYNAGLKRFRSDFVFRGVANSNWDLPTSLMRLGGDYAAMERPMLRHFRKYGYGHGGVGNSVWNWLAVAQHHGLPTRLLDWTYSPFVAAHFATENREEMASDAAIWCVNTRAVAALMPPRFREVLEREGARAFTAEMLDRLAPDLESFDAAGREQSFVVFFDPPSLDDRVVNQHALFSIASEPTLPLDAWLRGHPDSFRRVVVPAALKWEVRDKLDQANISERMLFPGLDGIARYLKRHYSPGPETGVAAGRKAAGE
jgi:hypothetical protein